MSGCVTAGSSGKVTIWALRVKTLQSPQIQAAWLRWSSLNIRSVMTRSQDTRLLFLPANTEALYNLLISHKVGQRWGQRRRSGFRFCWLIRFWRGVFVWDRVALRLVNYFEKRVVRRSWFEIGDSSLTDRTGEGGADHLEQRRSNPLIIGKKNLASDCHRDHHHHDCQQDHKQGH